MIGPDADLRFTSSIVKTDEKRAHVDWHQDSVYDKDPEHHKLIVWVAVTESRRDNGGLRLIPGSHLGGPVSHIPSRSFEFDKEIESVDESLAEDVEMEPGDLVVMDRHLMHASWPSISGRLRMGMIAGFQPPKRDYLEFEKAGAFRYLRGGRPVWNRVIDPECEPY